MLIEQLTPLELDYLRMGAHSNQKIALHFDVAESTVKNHWRVINLKFGVPGNIGPKRLIIMIKALKLNIITLDEIKVPPRRCSL